METYRKVPTARRLVTSSTTSHDSDIILVMLQSSKSSHSTTKTRINYPCEPFKHTLSQNIALKNQLIRLRTLGEAFSVTALWPKFPTFHDASNCHPCFAACSV